MNSEEKSRITQNLTYLKERLVDLDPLIDRLIENEVFRFEHRAQIEQISKPTPHRQFNEFIKLLTSSSSRDAYRTFVDALRLEGYAQIAHKLQKTTPKEQLRSIPSRGSSRIGSATVASTKRTIYSYEPASSPDDTGASGQTIVKTDGCTDCANTVKAVIEAFGKNQEKIIENIERQRKEDKLDLERQRQRDKQEYHQHLNHLFEKWQTERQEIVQNAESAIDKLQEQIDEVKKVHVEYSFLKEQYDYLREKQQGMREKDNERRERLLQLTKEKEEGKRENQKLESKIDHLETKLQMCEDTREDLENKTLENARQIENLEFEKDELLKQLKEKEGENRSLREKVEDQYKQITELLQKERDKEEKHDDTEYAQTVEQQIRKLDLIYGMMQSISKEKPVPIQAVRLECKPKKMPIGTSLAKQTLAERRKNRIDRYDS